MIINNQYITTFLSSYKIFKNLENNHFSIDELLPYLFIETRNNSNNKIVPDYIFKEIEFTLFKKSSHLSFIILDFFEQISSYLYVKEQKLYVKEEFFEEWQEIITRVSPIMIISYFIFKSNNHYLLDNFENSLLVSIYNKRLEYLFQKYKIYDLHIHLNGTTEFDIVWQDLLKNPDILLADYVNGFKEPSVKEEYFEIGIFDIIDYIKNIKKIRDFRINFNCNYTVKCEITFFITMFQKITDNNSLLLDIENFYKYMLMYNTNYKLLVQQLNQIGFDSFQKITNIQIREHTEKEYIKRYQQVKTIYMHDNIKIEGRFAPKKDISKLVDFIDTIKRANSSELSLVSHFIKKKDNLNDELILYRDKKLRKELKVLGENILILLSKKEYEGILNGFDAASNELHARPEVFAPLFNRLKTKGYDNFTFHGGEDFIDLVSGIRYIYEILEFLEFDSGNRLGHATALGISPKLWQKRAGKILYISQGEYLDNLVFVYMLLSSRVNIIKTLPKILEQINSLCIKIYGNVYNIEELKDSWRLRKNDPESFLENCNFKFVSEKLFKMYHTDRDTIEAYNKKISFNTNFFTHKELKLLQNIVIEKINSKNIIIESMITSNKMISFYNSYDEHHILRWLLKSPKPIVVLASDDPGIFATNIKNELAHLYLILKKKLDNEEEVFQIIKKLIVNSIIYKFGENT